MNAPTQVSFNRYKKYATDLRRYYRLPAVQTSLSLVLSIFITAFFILAAIKPTLVTIAKLNTKIEESEKTAAQLKTKAQALQQISQTWEEVMPLQKFIDSSIPTDGPAYQPLVQAMEILALESGVGLVSETIGEALIYSKIVDPYSGNKRTVVQIPFTVRVSGSYLGTSDFFTKLTKLDRVISIESIGFSKDVKSAVGTTGVSFTLTGSVSYLADDAQLAKILTATEKRGK